MNPMHPITIGNCRDLAASGNINCDIGLGWTMLMKSVYYAEIECIVFLVDNGASCIIVNSNELTVINYAGHLKISHPAIYKMLADTSERQQRENMMLTEKKNAIDEVEKQIDEWDGKTIYESDKKTARTITNAVKKQRFCTKCQSIIFA